MKRFICAFCVKPKMSLCIILNLKDGSLTAIFLISRVRIKKSPKLMKSGIWQSNPASLSEKRDKTEKDNGNYPIGVIPYGLMFELDCDKRAITVAESPTT